MKAGLESVNPHEVLGANTLTFYKTYESLCKSRGLSVSRAATAAGLHRSAVTAWRKGRLPNSATLRVLAEFFDVTVQYLLSGTLETEAVPNTGKESIKHEAATHTKPSTPYTWAGTKGCFCMNSVQQNLIWAQKEKAIGELRALCALLFRPEEGGGPQYETVKKLVDKMAEDLNFNVG